MRALLILFAALVAGPAWGKGTLVIVGGGLSADNAEIYRAFIDKAEGGKIAIIPSASGEPQASLDAFAANLVRHGVDSARIIQIKLAEIDDPATSVDEAAWAGNARDAGEIAKIQAASAIWFTGGDQARTMRLLTRNWEDTPMLAEIRKRLASGAVVGGTSAGAAIMGSGMIICGDPRRANDAISRDPADCATLEGETEPLVVGNGLGFLTNGIVDQHFSQRARLPRLVRAVTYLSGTGIGIDEDTALFVDLRSSRALVMGKGFVTTVRVNGNSNYAAGTMRNARLDQYRAGESFVVGK